jgi:hypothetical protein
MAGRRPLRARLCGARQICQAKSLFRSCEPEQCKRLFKRLSTEQTAAGQCRWHWQLAASGFFASYGKPLAD